MGRPRFGIQHLVAVVAACTVLSSCAPTRQAPSPGEEGASGRYKVGTPYVIDGVTYRPAVDYGYVETGVASWYGSKFHGRPTANGEVFDMNALSAAHRTLPMPSMVRVTNLENGRSLVLRVNDRGPFAKNRIIDISRRGAQLLGFRSKGLARVKVEILETESRRLAGEFVPNAPDEGFLPAAAALPEELRILEAAKSIRPSVIEAAPLPAVGRAGTDARSETPRATRYFIQAGAFRHYDNAIRLKAQLSQLGAVVEMPPADGAAIFRVRLGPFMDAERARGLLAVITSKGQSDARLVYD